MKKLFTIMLLVVAALTSFAQSAHSIYFWHNGSVVDSLVIDSLTFAPRTFEKDTTVAYVDLGLSVKWATCNLGASEPFIYGDYYAWGETSPKKTFTEKTYKFMFWYSTSYAYTKYTTDRGSAWGTLDNKTKLEACDDAATVTLGQPWRIPTVKEWKELQDSCTWKEGKKYGIKGYTVTGKNGNSIFLPCNGYYQSGSSNTWENSSGYYWTSERDTSIAGNVYVKIPNITSNSSKNIGIEWRYSGLGIRPVRP